MWEWLLNKSAYQTRAEWRLGHNGEVILQKHTLKSDWRTKVRQNLNFAFDFIK
jgi:hypothetical protein